MTALPPDPGRAVDDSLPDPPRRRSFSGRFNAWLEQLLIKWKLDEIPHLKRFIITVVGGTIIILGLLLVVAPGPGAIVVVPVGVAVLSTEYAWARLMMRKARAVGRKALSRTQKIMRRR